MYHLSLSACSWLLLLMLSALSRSSPYPRQVSISILLLYYHRYIRSQGLSYLTGIYDRYILRVWLNIRSPFGLINASDASMNGYRATLRTNRVCVQSASHHTGIAPAGIAQSRRNKCRHERHSYLVNFSDLVSVFFQIVTTSIRLVVLRACDPARVCYALFSFYSHIADLRRSAGKSRLVLGQFWSCVPFFRCVIKETARMTKAAITLVSELQDLDFQRP